MMGKDFENPYGLTLKNGNLKMMSSLMDSGVFPGNQGGPLEHVIAAKAVAFREALSPDFKKYMQQVKDNATLLAAELVAYGYDIISGGTDNHMMLIDLSNKNINGKQAEEALGKAHITVNKNMVPFDTKSPFITSGIRIGTAAITTRGISAFQIKQLATIIDSSIINAENASILKENGTAVKSIMSGLPLFLKP
jgi:glycine hydroxymethyltransferase